MTDIVFEDFKREYLIAKKLPYVRKPVSYALYQTWKKWDRQEIERKVMCCDTCKWWDDYSGACCNGLSPHVGDFTSRESSCSKWEMKDGEKDSV